MFSKALLIILALFAKSSHGSLSRDHIDGDFHLRHARLHEQDHHGEAGTSHPSSTHVHAIPAESDGIITSCEPPLGPIQEHWWFPDPSRKEKSCNININECCGPLIEILNCTEPAQPFPGLWNEGICLGYSAYDCCFIEDGIKYFTFTACYDTQSKIVNEWENFDCYHFHLSECCGPRTNVTSSSCPLSSYVWPCEGDCCGVEQNWTLCPPETERWPRGWTDDVCFGLMEECCYAADSVWDQHRFPACYDTQRPIPGKWTDGLCTGIHLMDCCAVPENFYTCPDHMDRWPVGWNDTVCFGLLQECCYDPGYTTYAFPACYESQVKIPGTWNNDTCTAGRVSDCCATPENITSCTEFTEPWPEGWYDGVCVGLFDQCCYDNTGYGEYTFPSCYPSQEKIPERWEGGNCTGSRLSDCCITDCSEIIYEGPCSGPCCGVEQKFTICPPDYEQASGWMDGSCFGLLESCCTLVDPGEEIQDTFTDCPESQDEIAGKWEGGACVASSVEECCSVKPSTGGTLSNSTITSNTTSAITDSSSSKGRSSTLVVEIVMALVCIAWQ